MAATFSSFVLLTLQFPPFTLMRHRAGKFVGLCEPLLVPPSEFVQHTRHKIVLDNLAGSI